ncbi:NADH2 dehydrogenase (ubiquinone) chain [Fusarium albosuccineum]|uniref:NADH2 dehydrogenase (Ubiquinone) chain n=1 Tax=Fusarium albosuccineum TaxID=1237068 RepID=A0A8H4P4M2_9HYPO|nr:NADH2 dehydrogenase (ubiquinone) chain [Fusarium albosuccineum]
MTAKYAFTKSLREVRFLFCQTSEQSAAVRGLTGLGRQQYRSFLTRAYPTMKRNNPNIPILIREAAGTQPKVYARYGAPPSAALDRAWSTNERCTIADRGTEKSQILEGLSDKQIEDAVTGLVQPAQ